MSEDIKRLNPNNVWDIFYQLTQIPRPSKKEMKAAQFVKEYGESLGLDAQMDSVGNVIIRKPATPGYENRKGVILQGHIDMVPQKNSDIDFNFETDPIDAYIDGDWVTARGTTLGSDNGMGISLALSVLKDKNLKHGPLELLVTIDEETGMTGAFALKPNLLNGDILINLDSEEENALSVGCAGGVDVLFSFKFRQMPVPKESSSFFLVLEGLKGGHSGLDIHLGRANACKLMGFSLKKLISECGIQLASIKCGNMRNAIPREGCAHIVVPNDKHDLFLEKVDLLQKEWIYEYGQVEPALSFTAKESPMPTSVIEPMVQDDLINALCAAPNGVIRMSDSMDNVVESSTNLSMVTSSDQSIEGCCLVRSFVDSAKDNIASSLESCFRLAGADVVINNGYPGWKPNPKSEIRAIMEQLSEECFGKRASVVAMHAGLECGILGATYPKWDMISMGPTLKYPHSPDERVEINSVERVWNYLVKVLENIPKK